MKFQVHRSNKNPRKKEKIKGKKLRQAKNKVTRLCVCVHNIFTYIESANGKCCLAALYCLYCFCPSTCCGSHRTIAFSTFI